MVLLYIITNVELLEIMSWWSFEGYESLSYVATWVKEDINQWRCVFLHK
jgi:hypothetical protein